MTDSKPTMAKPSRTNTAMRIIETSLQLFNEQGERNISTNHIANHMGISPGNLYYHFANKDEIIVQLFKRYGNELLAYFSQNKLPESVPCDVELSLFIQRCEQFIESQRGIIGRTQRIYTR